MMAAEMIDSILSNIQQAFNARDYYTLNILLSSHILNINDKLFAARRELFLAAGILRLLNNIINQAILQDIANDAAILSQLLNTTINILSLFALTKFPGGNKLLQESKINNNFNEIQPLPPLAVNTVLSSYLKSPSASNGEEEKLQRRSSVSNLNKSNNSHQSNKVSNHRNQPRPFGVGTNINASFYSDSDSDSNAHSSAAQNISNAKRKQNNSSEEPPALEQILPPNATASYPANNSNKKQRSMEIPDNELQDVEISNVSSAASSIVLSSDYMSRDRAGESLCLVPRCSKAEYKFSADADIQLHMQINHNFFLCFGCGERFQSPITLASHHSSRIHCAGNFDFLCSYCGKDFQHQHVLRKHIGTHEKEFQCRSCMKRFANQTKLKYHNQSAHPGNENDDFEEFSRGFHNATSDSKQEQKNTSKAANSDETESESDSEAEINNNSNTDTSFAKEEPFGVDSAPSKLVPLAPYKMNTICPVKECETDFTLDRELKEHILENHNSVMCFRCRVLFPVGAHSALMNHFLTAHPQPHTELMCEYCGVGYRAEYYTNSSSKPKSGRQYLKQHERVHYEFFECERCGKRFNSTRSYTDHKYGIAYCSGKNEENISNKTSSNKQQNKSKHSAHGIQSNNSIHYSASSSSNSNAEEVSDSLPFLDDCVEE
jgi:hypothetical protein